MNTSAYVAKERFLDRVEQSFFVFQKQWLYFWAAFFIFQIIGTVILPEIFFFLFDMVAPLDKIGSTQNTAYIWLVITVALAIGMLYFLTYLLLIIPFQLSLLKGIKDTLEQKEIDIQKNIVYGFKNLFSAFKVYWYIFQYMFLIPALILILIGCIVIAALLTGKDFFPLYNTSLWEMENMWREILYLAFIIGWIIFIGVSVWFFFIYRGVKTSFSLIHAFHTEDFSKESFSQSLAVSKNNWWRIVWNLITIGIFGWLVIGIVTQLLGSLEFATKDTSFISKINTSEPIDWKNILGDLGENNFISFCIKLIETGLSTILTIFVTIFTYILYLRLYQENMQKNPREIYPDIEKTEEL